MGVTFLCIRKLRGKDIIHVAARHNLREFILKCVGEQGSIDTARTSMNYVLRGPGSALEVFALVQELMSAACVKSLRKDAVMALEVVMSLPPSLGADYRAYFEDSVQWVEKSFGVPVLSAAVHLDQAAPHCHVLLLPLVGSRMVGSDLMGGRATLAARQEDYFKSIGKRYGFARPVARKRLSKTVREDALQIAHALLQSRTDLGGELIGVLLAPHASDPLPLIKAMGIDLSIRNRMGGDFVRTMTANCAPRKAKHLGVRNVEVPVMTSL